MHRSSSLSLPVGAPGARKTPFLEVIPEAVQIMLGSVQESEFCSDANRGRKKGGEKKKISMTLIEPTNPSECVPKTEVIGVDGFK